MTTRSRPSTTRARAIHPLGLLLSLGTLAATLQGCTTEVVTPVPSDQAEEPAADGEPEPDDPGEDDGPDDDEDRGDRDGDRDDDSDGDRGRGSDDDDRDDDDDDEGDEDDDEGDDDDDGAEDYRGPGEEVHGIPVGQMPPPGRCRIWDPDLPPGRQSPPGDCEDLRERLTSGSWLLYRPTNAPRVYRIG